MGKCVDILCTKWSKNLSCNFWTHYTHSQDKPYFSFQASLHHTRTRSWTTSITLTGCDTPHYTATPMWVHLSSCLGRPHSSGSSQLREAYDPQHQALLPTLLGPCCPALGHSTSHLHARTQMSFCVFYVFFRPASSLHSTFGL